jgi:L-alanine-DL-glutamate epimerase-like enolase superfamily enzyme
MANVDYAGRRGEFIGAVGAVDCALWDLRGRREHRPVWELLGGRQRDTVPAYASMMDFSTEPQALHERAQEAREAGFHAQKWFVRCGPADGEAGVARNLAQFDALRNSLGDNYPLMLDAWTAWDLPFAEQMCIGLRNHRLEWIEEPLPADDLEAHVELKARTGVRIASGEHLFTRAELNPYLKARVLDVAQFDIAWTGGITEALEACKAVAAGGLTAIPHGSSLAATLHFVFAQPAALCPSISYVSRIAARAEALLTPQPVPREGAFTPPMGPGLGIDIEPGKVASSETLQWS